jgi:hypothetical protein
MKLKPLQINVLAIDETTITVPIMFDPMSGLNADGKPNLFMALLPDGRKVRLNFAGKSLGGQLREQLSKGESVTLDLRVAKVEVREHLDVVMGSLAIGHGTVGCEIQP